VLSREEAEEAKFMEDEAARFTFGDPGMPGYGVEHILAAVSLNQASFRLEARPTDAWELARAYFDALGYDPKMCEMVFMDQHDAFLSGVALGRELGGHEAEEAHEEARANREPFREQNDDAAARESTQTQA
jgi:hypothetical protein